MSILEKNILIPKKIKLTKDEISEIVNAIEVPYDGIPDVINVIQNGIRNNLGIDLESIKLYPGKFGRLKESIVKAYQLSVIGPKTPIGPRTADAIAQQQAQANFNTFHSVGTIKSGGVDGTREAISISRERKNAYGTLHFNDESLMYEEVMNLQKDFLGISVKFLSSSIKPYVIDPQAVINGQVMENDWWYQSQEIQDELPKIFPLQPLNPQTSYEAGLALSGSLQSTYRFCIRITLDQQKLFEFRISPVEIGSILDKAVIKLNKNEIIGIKAICSPGLVGVIDVFIKKQNGAYDDYLMSFIQFDEFAKIFVSGIPGITNFYAVKHNISSLIRDGESIDGKLHLYLNDNRFIGIPFFRFEKLINAANYFLDSQMIDVMDIDALFDYNPIISMETRKIITISATTFLPVHGYYTVEKIENDLWKLEIQADQFGIRKSTNQINQVILKEFRIDNGSGQLSDPILENQMPKIIPPNYSILQGEEIRQTIILKASGYHSTHSYYQVEQIGQVGKLGQVKSNTWKLTLNLSYINSGYTPYSVDRLIADEFPTLSKEISITNVVQSQQVFNNSSGFPEIRESITVSAFDFIPKYPDLPYQVKKISPDLWKITLDLQTINERGFTPQMIDNSIYEQFSPPHGKKYEITKIRRIRPVDHIIIDTTDDYDTFIAKINHPLSKLIKSGKSDQNDQSTLQIRFKPLTLFQQISISSIFGRMNIDQPFDVSEDENGVTMLFDTNDNFNSFKEIFIKFEEGLFQNYYYAETTGCDLEKVLNNSNINNRKTWCNNYHQTAKIFGIESLRNLLVLDLKNMINSSSYINGKYLELVPDVMTYAGINPMTSEGILCHGRGSLAYATFDRVINHLFKAMLVGKKESTASTSISIIIGEQFKFGTGGFQLQDNRIQLVPEMNETTDNQFGYNIETQDISTDIYQGPDKLKAIVGNLGQNEINLPIPLIISNKLPMVSWIYNQIIIKDTTFYLQQGISALFEIKTRGIPVFTSSIELFQISKIQLKTIHVAVSDRNA